MNKRILDITCGMRGIWFDKHHPAAIYCDRRKEHFVSEHGTVKSVRNIDVNPDVLCDFTNLPFDDGKFDLVVFDPPHLIGNDNSWIKKMYSYYPTKEDALRDIKKGFDEGMRVLRDGGVLIFKWAETRIPTRDIINAIGTEPLFGHRSGKKSNTHWMCFMKIPKDETYDTSCTS